MNPEELEPVRYEIGPLQATITQHLHAWVNTCIHEAVERQGQGPTPQAMLVGMWEGIHFLTGNLMELALRELDLAAWLRETMLGSVGEAYRVEQCIRFAAGLAAIRSEHRQ